METRIPISIVQLEDNQNMHPVIEVTINGKPSHMVIDTGASHTCIDKKQIKNIKKKVDSFSSDVVMGIGSHNLSNTIVSINELTIGGLTIKDYPMVAIKISHINKMLQFLGINPIEGLLGSDILHKYNAIIDYKNCYLTLEYDEI